MKDKVHVLVFPAGEINSVELNDALSTVVNVKLFGASSIERHGSYVYKNYIPNLPLITDDNFIIEFNRVIEENDIDLIFPTHDTISLFLAENSSKIKTGLMVPDKETALICRDKKKTMELFSDCSFIPKMYDSIEYPSFIKPREGQGAKGTYLIKSVSDIPNSIDLDKYIINEYLPGDEYTVDCLTDKKGELIFISPRSRNRVMAGVSVSGKIEALTEDIKSIAIQINKRLNFKGLWWFQIKQDKKEKWKLLEISTRIAGTMCLTRARGVNLPLLSVYIAMGYEVKVFPNFYNVKVDRTLISRYKIDYSYDNVYLDFDDTLIVDNKVHLPTIQFVYQCKNKGKKIFLITKHIYNIYETLKRYNISKNLFDDIFLLSESEEKLDYIKPEKSIFIDNAYNERVSIYSKYKIPVFDVDGIEVLLDWRK